MIGAYGIVNRLAFFFVMIVMGSTRGCSPSQATISAHGSTTV